MSGVSPRTARAVDKFNKEFEKSKKEIFAFFDKDGDKFLKFEELVTAIRATGVIATESDIQRIHDSGHRDLYDYSIYSSLVESYRDKKKLATINSVHIDILKSMKQAYQSIDTKNTGRVTFESICEILSIMGDKLRPDEIKKLVPPGKEITFEQFVNMISMGVVAG
jgi:Ca2+-binding EF-hand superfamily protein